MIKQETKKKIKKTNKKNIQQEIELISLLILSCTCFHEIKINLIKENPLKLLYAREMLFIKNKRFSLRRLLLISSLVLISGELYQECICSFQSIYFMVGICFALLGQHCTPFDREPVSDQQTLLYLKSLTLCRAQIQVLKQF